MIHRFTRFAAVAAVAALLPVAAGAQVSFFTSQALWTAALNGGASGLDTFNDLPGGSFPSPVNRTAGAFNYIASVTAPAGQSTLFFPAGNAADRWLSTDYAGATMRFASFTAGTNAIGGEIFGSNLDGAFQSGPITVAWATTAGSGSTTVTAPSSTSFWGLVTTGSLTSLSITGVDSQSLALWGTANNVRLGQARPTVVIPEPSTYALMATGLVALGLIRRRRA
ncbi:MAG: PEP-CTERM sorting domain-containing protein [Gemmatimonadaceae bacterium]|jgi:hypothetical protein|nr:PEP-CTERM sorting domain-containing protein [Gemmatimonadaceae bacterium]